jgi:hypothetical protein
VNELFRSTLPLCEPLSGLNSSLPHIATHKELAEKLKELEGEVGEHNKLIIEIFEIIKQLTRLPVPPPKPKGPIGFGRP